MVYLNKIKITMIKKYKIFKESLLNHLEGPTEEEVWIGCGGIDFFQKAPKTPNEFLDKIIESSEIKETPTISATSYWFKTSPNEYVIITTYDLPRTVKISPDISKIIINYYYDYLLNKFGKTIDKSWLLKYFYKSYFNNYEPSESSLYW